MALAEVTPDADTVSKPEVSHSTLEPGCYVGQRSHFGPGTAAEAEGSSDGQSGHPAYDAAPADTIGKVVSKLIM
jgi:hypothetical protein